jgi:hypothetical protein
MHKGPANYARDREVEFPQPAPERCVAEVPDQAGYQHRFAGLGEPPPRVPRLESERFRGHDLA